MQRNLPNRITFQWHITDKCNFRCKHCYQDSYQNKGISFDDQLKVLNKLTNFTLNCKQESNLEYAHINFTGGEPFLRNDFISLLEYTRNKGIFSFGILSNGFLPSDEILKRLVELKPRFVQISLEGNKITNEQIRGEGSFNYIIKAIDTYRKINIPVMISFTANSINYKQFPDVVKIARRHNVYKIWTDRHLPNGKKDELALNTTQAKEFFNILLAEQKKNKKRLFSKTMISSNRALQFLISGGQPYKCSAGETLLAILPNGDILPCRRLPIKIGNLLTHELIHLYKSNQTILDIINPQAMDKQCKECYYINSCNGGLKCLSYAVLDDFNKKDSNCWLETKKC